MFCWCKGINMECNAMKLYLEDVYNNRHGVVDVAKKTNKVKKCDFCLDDYAKIEVCSGCEKGCKLSTQIVYRWPGFLVAQPIINGWVVASYLDEKNVLQSAEIGLSQDSELTKEEVANAHNDALQNARKIVSILCTAYKKR